VGLAPEDALHTPGAASNEISKSVHADYEKNKYTFHGYLTSAALALSVCDAAKDCWWNRST